MTTPATPSDSKPVGAAAPVEGAQAPAVSPIDEQIHGFWKKNRESILVLCGLLMVFYVGRAAWDSHVASREAAIQAEYAAATAAPEKLEVFAAAHAGHVLAAVAQLQLADFAYAQQRAVAAVDGYSRAAAALKEGPLAARARLGLAMARIQAGQTETGVAALRELSGDLHQFKAVRAEATYQLASLAASAGRADEVQKLSVQVMQIDPNSSWAQRAFALQARVPAAAAAPAQPVASPKPAAGR